MPLFLILAVSVALTACAETRSIPVVDLRPWRPIGSVCADTPETRKEIRAHNSTLDSLKTGRKVVYSDACPKEQPKPTS